MILADATPSGEAALAALLPLQREDFIGLLEAMDGLPGHHPAARPAAARVPARPHRARRARRRSPRRAARTRPRTTAAARRRRAAARGEPDAGPARRAAGPGRARACSPCRSAPSPRPPPSGKRAGGDPRAEIMVPLVGSVMELHLVRDEADASSPRSPTEPASPCTARSAR